MVKEGRKVPGPPSLLYQLQLLAFSNCFGLTSIKRTTLLEYLFYLTFTYLKQEDSNKSIRILNRQRSVTLQGRDQ